jgi:hypothetical protein
MKDYKKFLEEISIKDNDGIPGKGSEPKYVKSVEDRAKERFGINDRTNSHTLIPRIMQLVGESQGIISGKEVELENLATKVIMDNYGAILDGIKLDIKFARGRRAVKNFMDDCDSETCKLPELRKVEDPELKSEVDKRKIANLITQGEAKNTKHILNMPEVKEGIKQILGERDGERAFQVWNEITSIADKLDWIIPIEAKSDMMENVPEGLAGACKVEWKPKEYKPEDPNKEEEKEEEAQEEQEESYNEFEITVKAIGVDFPMLLHEAVKGIYELITSAGIPGSEELAKKVLMNTDTFEDEAEDFRYGPEVAADLRDFLNVNTSVDDFPNIREFVFGKMIVLPAEDFLKLMKGILMKTDEARTQVDSLIAATIKELKDYDYNTALPNDGEDDYNTEPTQAETPQETKSDDTDYSGWSQSDLRSEIDDALDAKDYEKVKKLSGFIKDSMSVEIYLREANLIEESKINK